jgi:YbbR domain-containing protein
VTAKWSICAAQEKVYSLTSRKLLSIIAENWPAKVISIALAMVLFVFHRMNSLSERFFSVPLVLESQTNLVPANSYPRMIRITLRGDANSIYPIQDDDIQAFVDLSRFTTPGNYHAVVQIRKRGMALEVSPLEVRVDPGEISLSLDYKISKFVPLKVSLIGEVEPGFLLNSYSFNPTQVIIDGPSVHIGNITELDTEAIDLSGRDGDFAMRVNIINRNPLLVIRGTGVAEFSGYISRVVSVRNIQNMPVRITGLNENLHGKLGNKTVALHMEGRNQEELDHFVLPEDFLYVDCSVIREPGTYMLKIQGDIPPNLVLSVDPPEMMIQINLAERIP